MAKPITAEMLHAMSLEQRKTLHKNALSLGTPAAQAVIELLSQDELLGKPKAIVVPKGTKKVATGAPKVTKPKVPKAAAAPKSIKAVHGRQA